MKTVEEVARIEDPLDRLAAASELARKAEAAVTKSRGLRDLAILTMLRPFADAVAATNAERARIRDDYESGRMTEEEYEAALAENREQRKMDLEAAGVTIQPVNVYDSPIGVSRGLVNRLLMRMPDGPLPPLEGDPATVARRENTKMAAAAERLKEAREIRATAALIVMDGRDEDGREFTPVSNAHVSRVTGLTTARIAQLREGAR